MNHWWFTTFISLHMGCVVQLHFMSCYLKAQFCNTDACREAICRGVLSAVHLLLCHTAGLPDLSLQEEQLAVISTTQQLQEWPGCKYKYISERGIS